MKRKMFGAAAIIAAVLLLAACAPKQEVIDNTTNNTGRYIETDISPDNSACIGLFANEDGSIDYLTQQDNTGAHFPDAGIHYYQISANNQVTELPTEWLETIAVAMPPQTGYSYSISFAKSGDTLYSLAQGTSDDGNESQFGFFKITDVGATEIPIQVDLSQIDVPQGPATLKLLQIVDENWVIASNGGDVFVYAPDGTQLGATKVGVSSSAVVGEYLLVPQGVGEGAVTEVYSLPSLKKEREIKAQGGTICADGADAFYILSAGIAISDEGSTASEKNLYRYLVNGTTEEIVLKGKDFSFGAPSSGVLNLLATADRSICIAMFNAGVYTLNKYGYDDSAPSQAEDTITIFSLRESPTVRQAITTWNAAHPEIGIDYVVGLSGDSGLTEEDIILQFNTELAAGKGPDILVLDGLPVQSLIEKGYLADLSATVDTESLYPNVASAFATNDKLYAVAARMEFYVIGGRPEDITEFSSLSKFVELVESQPAGQTEDGTENENAFILFSTAEGVFESLYPSWADAIWANNELNEDALREFLEESSRIVQHNNLRTARQLASEDAEGGQGAEGEPRSPESFMTNLSLTAFYNDRARAFCDIIPTAAGIATTFKTMSSPDTSAALSAVPGQDGAGRLQPRCIVGMTNEANPNSVAFIATLISDPVQQTRLDDGLPTNRAVLLGQYEVEAQNQNIEMATDVDALIENLKPVVLLSVPYSATLDASLGYYEGNMTIDQAISAAMEAAAIWIAEQKQ